jgi:hypothetical protein
MSTENTQTPLDVANDKAKELFDAYLADVSKFQAKGTASAVVRARKALSELAKHIRKELRKELQVAKRAAVEAKRKARADKKQSV